MFRWVVRVGIFRDDRDVPGEPVGIAEVELVHHDTCGAEAIAQELVRRALDDVSLKARALSIVPFREAEA